MSGFKVLATNHTSFTVSDLDRSVAFFRDVLGFEVTSKAPRNPDVVSRVTGIPGTRMMIAYVRGAGHSLELIQYLGPEEGRGRVRALPCDVGFAHVAYDVDDIEAAIAASAEHEVRLVGEVAVIDQGPNTGGKVAYLQDRDGVTIEYIQKPPGS
jgi:catechol 2,3-dioxygenase-like lactoylglutathione lyase family enzyme